MNDYDIEVLVNMYMHKIKQGINDFYGSAEFVHLTDKQRKRLKETIDVIEKDITHIKELMEENE